MSRLDRFERFWWVIALALLLVALAGPWVFDPIAIPNEYDCTPPYIRLRDQICGQPTSGIILAVWMVGWLAAILPGIFTGAVTFPDRLREVIGIFLVAMGALVLLLPLFTTFRAMQNYASQKWRRFHRFAWLAGATLSLLWLAGSYTSQSLHLWGNWLYLGIASSTFIFELWVMAAEKQVLHA